MGITGHEFTITSGGVSRSYIAWAPSSSIAPAKRVLFGLHGGGGNAQNFSETAGFHLRSSKYIYAYPQGLDNVWNTGADENGGVADDVGFLEDVLADLYSKFNVRAGKHFAAGFSNGAAMCYRMASERSDRIAAIATVSGVLDFVPLLLGDQVSILHQHGLEDKIYPYYGGQSITNKTREAVEDHMNRWGDRDGCGIAEPAVVHEGETATKRVCADGVNKHVLTAISGLGHAWPGDSYGTFKRLKVGPPRPDLDGTGVILDFFSGVVA